MPLQPARKRFGQHFLQDPYVIQQLIQAIQPKPGEQLVEIGPGRGALTARLLAATDGALQVIELDRDLIPSLKQRFGHQPAFHVHEADALTFNYQTLNHTTDVSMTDDKRPLRIVGNLPYNIATPLLFRLLDYHGLINDMHFMLQKEVVERLAARPGNKHYGRLSLMTQYYCHVDYLFTVGREAFKPIPKVTSAVVRLTPHTVLPHPCRNRGRLQALIRDAFNQRRKTLRNTLKRHLDANAFQVLAIDSRLRPEQLQLADFVRMADYLEDA